MRWWKKLWSSEAPPPAPILLRIVDPDGGLPGCVTVHATWFPSERGSAQNHRTAEGLCVIPWLGDERRVELTVRSGTGQTSVGIRRDRPDGGRVHELRLAEEPPWSGATAPLLAASGHPAPHEPT